VGPGGEAESSRGGGGAGAGGDEDEDALQEQQGAFTYAHIAQNLERLDLNQLQTALSTAIAAEDYALAAAIRDRFATLMADEEEESGGEGDGQKKKRRMLDWHALGVPEWLADRAGSLGLRFPTGGFESVYVYVYVCACACACACPCVRLGTRNSQ